MKDEAEAIVRRALAAQLINESQVEDCRRTRDELRSLGIEKSLVDVLVDYHHLTDEQIRGLAPKSSGGRAARRPPPSTPGTPAPAARPDAPAAASAAAVESAPELPPPRAPAPRIPDATIDFPVENAGPPIDSVATIAPPDPDLSGGTIAIAGLAPDSEHGVSMAEAIALSSDSAPASADDRAMRDLVGTVLGGCRLEEKLGAGAMGTVFRATHLALRRTVAVKLMNPSRFYQKRQIDQFFREARAAAAIEHQHIVGVHDVGQENALYYIVMQFIEGESLQERIEREKRLSIEEAVRLTIEAARGLAVAHKKGVVHRDVKPANIMLTEAGEVKIADFGLAWQNDEEGTMTGAGEVMGTPAYMAPEQIDGRQVDQRADLYSLGVMLYYMTTGQRPFEGATPMEVLLKHMSERFTPPVQVNPRIPRALGQVIERLMAKDPAHRYADAEELIRDLTELKEGGKPKVVVAMEDYIQKIEEIARATDEPVKTRQPLVAAVVSGIAAALCVVLLTVALPEVGAEPPALTGTGDPLLAEADRALKAAEDFAKQNPSEIGEIEKILETVSTEFEMLPSIATTARARLREYQRKYEELATQETAAAIAKAAKAAGADDFAEAILILADVPAVWRQGRQGQLIDGNAKRYLADLQRATGMTFVPPGPFLAGPDRRPEEILHAYFIDVAEVSNAEYEKFIAATRHAPPPHWRNGRPLPGTESLPVVGVSFSDAEAYATWAGKRLPTALEWEKAARGADGRIYPWGDEFIQTAVNCAGLSRDGLLPTTAHPGGRSPFGCLNMAGNAHEWTSTLDAETGLPLVFGGAWRSHPANVRTFISYPVDPANRRADDSIGFRLVRDP